jgi:imidazolonepropionase
VNNRPFVLWRNLNAFTMNATSQNPWGAIADAAMLTRIDATHTGSQLEWIGALCDLPSSVAAQIEADRDLGGACVTPALIDCHSHLVYAGNRAREFEMRLEGATYEDIARAGGGIRSTVAATRAASDDELLSLSLARARALVREGVGTIEIKSGYGLSEAHEQRCLQVARRVGAHLSIDVKTTYLAAHALPEEFAGRSDDYIDAVCDWMPRLRAAGLIDFVDVFCERIGFTREQTRRVFVRATELGLPVKLHAEQLSDQGGAALASEFDALSCDHLEYVTDEGVQAMANAGVTAVLLPGAFYFLRVTKLPPIEKLRAGNVPIALATDHNPGSSPTLSPLLMMNMACTLFRMTPLEAWRGFTVNAARALGLNESHGMLTAARRASFAVWNADHPRDLAYRFGHSPLKALVIDGEQRTEVAP